MSGFPAVAASDPSSCVPSALLDVGAGESLDSRGEAGEWVGAMEVLPETKAKAARAKDLERRQAEWREEREKLIPLARALRASKEGVDYADGTDQAAGCHVDYFKGEDYKRWMGSEAHREKVAKLYAFPGGLDVGDVDGCEKRVVELLLKYKFIRGAERELKEPRKKGKRLIKYPRKLLPKAVKSYVAEDDSFYIWEFVEENRWFNVMAVALVLGGVVAAATFPIWPLWTKKFLFYGSLGLLAIFFTILLVRLAVFLLLLPTGYDVWLMPNILNEEESLSKAFLTFWSVSKSKVDPVTRGSAAALLALSVVYVYTLSAEDLDNYKAAAAKQTTSLFDFVDSFGPAGISDSHGKDKEKDNRKWSPMDEL